MKLGIVEYIDCAHYLPGHVKCGVNHGHTYKLELIIEGTIRKGMVVDFADLRKVLRETVAMYDHRSLNDFLEYPSVENICVMVREELQKQITHPFTLRIWEGKDKWAEI